MRLPYVEETPKFLDPNDQAVVERVKERRGGNLIALDRALLNAPPVADGWNSFLDSIRTKTTIPDSIRELAICRIAVLNKAWYEWDAHLPILEATGAVSKDAISYLRSKPVHEEACRTGESQDLLDEQHAAVLDYTDAMTIGCVVPNPVFVRLENMFSEREVTEITATVAAYNCVSRFLVALDVGEMVKKYGADGP
ncbi:hypothetical protein AAFC00_004824 [Neodothiora populina]|uniref:Carboxymuconolactone decarboxylase-like domain-containing protein n=1 Tax=Neodothiora populina TaxID=2781224 RepID=A0ABR3P3F5_9PEZI